MLCDWICISRVLYFQVHIFPGFLISGSLYFQNPVFPGFSIPWTLLYMSRVPYFQNLILPEPYTVFFQNHIFPEFVISRALYLQNLPVLSFTVRSKTRWNRSVLVPLARASFRPVGWRLTVRMRNGGRDVLAPERRVYSRTVFSLVNITRLSSLCVWCGSVALSWNLRCFLRNNEQTLWIRQKKITADVV